MGTLIPADGFYEWQKQGEKKQPYLIHRRDNEPFAFAGLWESWGRDNELETGVIITTTPNAVMKPLHDRMPAIIEQADYDKWLDPATPAEQLAAMLKPLPDELLEAYPVSRLLNAPVNDVPGCVKELKPAEESRTLFES